MNCPPAWRAWHVLLSGKGRRLPLLDLVAAVTQTPWFWVDLPGSRPVLEIGLPAVDASRQSAKPIWIKVGMRAGLVLAASPRLAPAVCTPALFPAESCPAGWSELLAATTLRAVRILSATGSDAPVSTGTLAAELVDLYQQLAPRPQRPAAVAWHLQWLAWTVGPPANRLTPAVPAALPPDLPALEPDLISGLRSWSMGIPETSWSGPEPAWIPVIARLCHVQAVRLGGPIAGLQAERQGLMAVGTR